MRIGERNKESEDKEEEGELKVGESRVRKVMIQDEKGRGRGLAESEGLCRTPVWKERGRYWTEQGLSRHPAAGGICRAGTQAYWTDDVREKID